jgi:NitT/TauT family transport system substrate-binding protein
VKFLLLALSVSVCALFAQSGAFAQAPVRIAVLKFGTVNWELATISHHGLDKANGVDIEIVPYASPSATRVALLAGDADVIVSDWLFVSRQRVSSRDFVFVPYSTAVGSLMVPADSPIKNLSDLADKRVGVAGGPLDKNWLLLQGLAKDEFDVDLRQSSDIVFGAPPLLAQKAIQGELDAVLNYWHYSARLEAQGFRAVSSSKEAAARLGAKGAVSAIGYVFSQAWAEANPQRAVGFIKASRAAKQLLGESDTEWDRLAQAGVIRDKGEALNVLRDRFRQGIPARSVGDEQADAALLFKVLSRLGGKKLVGPRSDMDAGTYWQHPALTR